MPLETLPQRPSLEDYTPLAEHQSQTPISFFGGKPVLHAHLQGCDVLAALKEITAHEPLDSLWGANGGRDRSEHESRAGESSDSIGQMNVLKDVQVLVGSDCLILSKHNSPALSIPYPSISLHAIQRLHTGGSSPNIRYTSGSADSQGGAQEGHALNDGSESAVNGDATAKIASAVYLQIDPLHHLRSQMNPDEDDIEEAESDTITLYIVPTSRTEVVDTAMPSTNPEQAQSCFMALSACADLHPDEGDEEEDRDAGGLSSVLGGGLGQGGWITAENAHEFEGAFADAEEDGSGRIILGPGAGARRSREDEEVPTNGVHDDDQATNGEVQDETKWRRTS
ncbi:MAG: hypothetical protein M1828_005043 [Chrysothrix sp. TS-e1954]|nr:MAG: hypothetical protein M1828_005043 [Chrysothrix sp. TS-e1954]